MTDRNSEGNARIKYLLILGCQRSGTSLISSILGAHPSINMRMESFDDNILKAAGKPINGNKLLLHRQIQLNRRANVFGHLANQTFPTFKTFDRKLYRVKYTDYYYYTI